MIGCWAPGVAVFEKDRQHYFEHKPLDWPLARTSGAVGALALWNCATEACSFEDHLVGALCDGTRCVVAFPLGLAARGCFGWDPYTGAATLFPSIVRTLVERDGLLRTLGDAAALAYYATPQGCLHKWDLHMVWGDVRYESGLQLDAWLRRKGPAA